MGSVIDSKFYYTHLDRCGKIKQVMLEAFYLWYIYAHLAYTDILRPAGPKYIPVY